MDSLDIRIIEFEPRIDLSGAKIIDGFPSVGLVSTIAGNYLIDTLKLKQIGVMDNPNFPTLAVVHAGEPLSPVRIYAGEKPVDGSARKERIVVFVSEFQPNPQLTRPIASAIIKWAKERKCDMVISPEGLVIEGPLGEDDKIEIWGVGSSQRMSQLLKERQVPPFKEGIIAGVSGILLNLGRQENFDVVSILSEAHPNYPDARSASVVIQIIAKLLNFSINVAPLIAEAEGFEKQIKSLNQQAKQRQARTESATPSMYG